MGWDVMDGCWYRVGVDGTSGDVTASRTVATIIQLSNVGSPIVVSCRCWNMNRSMYWRMGKELWVIGGDVMDGCGSRVGVYGTSSNATASRTVAPIVQLSDVGSSKVVPWWCWNMHRYLCWYMSMYWYR
jgi:hypothetical protein